MLFIVNTLILRFAVPLSLLAVSKWAETQQLGFFNLLQAGPWVSVLACVLLLDLAIYGQHVATHKVAWLWRLHKVHHADRDMDVTTAIRFHPLELVLSLLYKSLIVIALGAPIMAVFIFELVLFVGAAFNHSNLDLPAWLDSSLRRVIATPDVHRVHHSVYRREQDSNYAFFLIWWDKLFNTYTPQPADGHLDMKIGLVDTPLDFERVDQMLAAPFR